MQGFTSVLGGAGRRPPLPATPPRRPRPRRSPFRSLARLPRPQRRPLPAAARRALPRRCPAAARRSRGATCMLPRAGLPVPLPQQLSFPGDLASLMPAG